MKRIYSDGYQETGNTIISVQVEDLDIRALSYIVSEADFTTKRAVFIQLRAAGKVLVIPSNIATCKDEVTAMAAAYTFDYQRRRAAKYADVFDKLDSEPVEQ